MSKANSKFSAIYNGLVDVPTPTPEAMVRFRALLESVSGEIHTKGTVAEVCEFLRAEPEASLAFMEAYNATQQPLDALRREFIDRSRYNFEPFPDAGKILYIPGSVEAMLDGAKNRPAMARDVMDFIFNLKASISKAEIFLINRKAIAELAMASPLKFLDSAKEFMGGCKKVLTALKQEHPRAFAALVKDEKEQVIVALWSSYYPAHDHSKAIKMIDKFLVCDVPANSKSGLVLA